MNSSLKTFFENKKLISKILVILFNSMGDVLMISPIFETLKKSYPNASLYFLSTKEFSEIITEHPFIDHFIYYAFNHKNEYFFNPYNMIKMIFKIRKMKYDIIIDAQSALDSRLITMFSASKCRIGRARHRLEKKIYFYRILLNKIYYNISVDYKPIKFDYTFDYKPETYLAYQNFDLLKPLKINPEVPRFYINISNDSQSYIDCWLESIGLKQSCFVVISPGTKKFKKWKTENFAVLGDLIYIKYGLKTVLTHANQKEKMCCHNVYDMMETKPFISVETDIFQALALIKRAELLICNDQGLLHASCGVGVKTIAIFGPTYPPIFSPAAVFKTHHHLYSETYKNKKDNTFGITPSDVINTIDKFFLNKEGLNLK